MNRIKQWIGGGWCLLAFAAAGCGTDEPAKTPPAETSRPAVDPASTSSDAARQQQQAERLGRLEQRIDTARAAVQLDLENPAARQELGLALFAAGRGAEAIEQLEQAVRLYPHWGYRMNLALVYSANSRLDAAAAIFTELIGEGPEEAVLLNNLGNIKSKRGDHPGAIELYRKSIALRPDYLLANVNLAQALEKNGQFKEAYRTFEKVVSLEPQTVEETKAFDDSLYGLGALDLKMGDYPRAARILATLIETSPEHAQAYYSYGQALLQLGRTTEAQRALDIHMQLLARQAPSGPVATGE